MLNWWLGRPMEGKYLQDENPEPEQPETPAPVFAARALKSAIFGTPAPPDETIYEVEDTEDIAVRASKDDAKPQPRDISPTKPPGILLTPGTATTRRKTVSFGNEVVEKEAKTGTAKAGGKKDIRDSSSGKIPTSWNLTTEGSVRVTRKTALTKTLENAREGKTPKAAPESTRDSFDLQPLLSASARESKICSAPELQSEGLLLPKLPTRTSSRPQQDDGVPTHNISDLGPLNSDATMDLNEPHSQSGKYWKSEYEQYHSAARAEMERLITYKVLAKSFAKMKDDEATAMAQKLEEEQKKAIQMESRVSQLSAKIASSGPDGTDNSPEMIKQLARQTALALQYRAEVEELRATMEASGRAPTTSSLAQRQHPSPCKIDHSMGNQSKGVREQPSDTDALRSEIKQLRQSLASAEVKNAKLQDENTKLTQELLHADLRHTNHLEKCDQRRDSLDSQLQRKDERLQNLQKDFDKFKEIAKKSRRDAEHLLKKRHDQAVELRKEIASLRSAESTAQELKRVLHKQTLAHEEVVTRFQKQKERSLEKETDDSVCVQDSQDYKEMDEKVTAVSSTRLKDPSVGDSSFKRDSQIPVLASISRPSKVLAPTKSMRSETSAPTRPRSSNRALSEIVNGASVDTIPPDGFGPVQRTPVPVQMIPLAERYSSMPPESPELQLPSPEPSLPLYNSNRAIHERNCHASPRPSMFNIASSPPKAVFVRPRTNELSKQRSSNNLGGHSTQPMSVDVSRAKRNMDPDRLAAAKARLEQKRRIRESDAQKENVPC